MSFLTSLRLGTRFLLFFVILMFCVGHRVNADSDDSKVGSNVKNKPSISDFKNNEVFIATNEWQVVRKGQPIPRGLHVRINFETGKTEAKLLDPAESSKQTAVTVVQEKTDVLGLEEKDNSEGDIPKSDYVNLQDAMRNIRGDDHRGTDDAIKESVTTSKKTFKTYEQLKQDIADMDMQTTTDMEMLVQLITEFPTASPRDQVVILTDLEYLVHQIDNAVEFARLDGFAKVVYPSFNNSDVGVRSAAVRLLGSAVQNNPQVQSSALSSGSVPLLLRRLMRDQDETVQSSALYALSCLVRSFPAAQAKMVNEGGLVVLAHLFERKDNNKLQIKVVTLLYDLLQENQSADATSSQRPDLESRLLELGWCELIPDLLTPETSHPDNDVVEKVANAMSALVNVCKPHFERPSVKTALLRLEENYKRLAEEDPDEYFFSMAELLRNLLVHLSATNT